MLNGLKLGVFFVFCLQLLVGCSSYSHEKAFNLFAVTSDLSKGTSVGVVSGRTCSWSICGYPLGRPKVDRAVIQAVRESGHPIRYLNHLKVKPSSWNVFFVGRRCLDVQGEAFQ